MATTSSAVPVFLMSRPRDDWQIRGRANVFAAALNEAGAVSPTAAEAQRDWDVVKDAIGAAGGKVVVVDNPDPLLTGLPYTAEAGVMGKDRKGLVFVLPQLTPPHRQAEPAVVKPAVEALGIRTVDVDTAFEGQGDVIDVGPDASARFACTSGEGKWARTSPLAHERCARFLPGKTLHLRFHADPWFHGNTFLGGYRNGANVVVVVCPDALLDDGYGRLLRFVAPARIVNLSAEQTLTYATNALQVNETVLAPVGVPDVVVDAWRGLGLTVKFLELPALFRKGGGAAVCLTNRLWGFTLEDDT